VDTLLPAEAERIAVSIGIPPCPTVLTKLVQEARADEPDLSRIARLVETDVGLAATVIKLANGVIYGGTGELVSIRHALLRIGVQNVIQLVTSLLLKQAFPAGNAEGMERFWTSSARIAELSAVIAAGTGAADRELAYSYGLFRHCGTAAMLARFPDYERTVMAAAKIGRRLTDVEQVRYGANHAQIGYLTAQQWLLPAALADAVLHHHGPDAQRGRRSDLKEDSMRLIAVGALAERAQVLDAGDPLPAEMESAASLALLQLGLKEAEIAKIACAGELTLAA